jgi:hypothetical protein
VTSISSGVYFDSSLGVLASSPPDVLAASSSGALVDSTLFVHWDLLSRYNRASYGKTETAK